jgi:hypothetical protein
MVTIRQIRDLPEALLAKGSLESAGIEVVLTDENIVRIGSGRIWWEGSSSEYLRKMWRLPTKF